MRLIYRLLLKRLPTIPVFLASTKGHYCKAKAAELGERLLEIAQKTLSVRENLHPCDYQGLKRIKATILCDRDTANADQFQLHVPNYMCLQQNPEQLNICASDMRICTSNTCGTTTAIREKLHGTIQSIQETSHSREVVC